MKSKNVKVWWRKVYVKVSNIYCTNHPIKVLNTRQCNAPSSMSGEYIYSGGFWDSKACAVCARWDRSGAAAPNSAPKIVWQFLEPSLVLLQQSTDQSEKSCEDNLPVSSNISKPNSAPKRCDRIGSALVATWKVSSFIETFKVCSRARQLMPSNTIPVKILLVQIENEEK